MLIPPFHRQPADTTPIYQQYDYGRWTSIAPDTCPVTPEGLDEARRDMARGLREQNHRRCSYCGSLQKTDRVKCANCGGECENPSE